MSPGEVVIFECLVRNSLVKTSAVSGGSGTYPSDIMINNLSRRKQSLRCDHDSSSGIKVGTGKDQLMGTSRRLSAISPSDNSAHRQHYTCNTGLESCQFPIPHTFKAIASIPEQCRQ